MPTTPRVCLIEAHLHFSDSHDLKGKRKHLHSIKGQLRARFGVAVAETEGHDTWQRSALLIALVGGAEVEGRADDVERYLWERCPDGCSFERTVRTLEDLRP